MEKGFYTEKRSKKENRKGTGLVHACYGQGVGKTTRSIGLAVRAAGAGLKVAFVQFMKSGDTSEANSFALIPNITYRCPGEHSFIGKSGPEEAHLDHARTALEYAREALGDGTEVLVCDEILNTLLFGVLTIEDVLGLAQNTRQAGIELVMTGVSLPPELLEAVDYATELKQVKHPYYQGQEARLGIEF